MTAINRGFFISAVFSLILVIVAAFSFLPAHFSQLSGVTERLRATTGTRAGSPSSRW